METPHDPVSTTSVPPHTDPLSEPTPASPPKADLAKRFVALLIDGIIAGVLFGLCFSILGWRIGYFLGALVAGAYYLLRDGLDVDFMKHRSLGKKLMKLRPVRLDGRPMDLETSARRNWMFALSYIGFIPFLGFLPDLVGFVVGLIALYECYKVITDAEGRRWGDEMAGTRVIETAD